MPCLNCHSYPQGKLIKLFSKQLVVKSRLREDDLNNIPSLSQWLQVVGLSKESIQGICQKVTSLEELKQKPEHELRTILNEKNARPEEFGRLNRALYNLCRYTGMFIVLISRRRLIPIFLALSIWYSFCIKVTQ